MIEILNLSFRFWRDLVVQVAGGTISVAFV